MVLGAGCGFKSHTLPSKVAGASSREKHCVKIVGSQVYWENH